jgi:flagellar capping protein FliD
VGAAKALLEGVTGSNGVLTSTVKILQDDITAQDRLIQENQTRIDQLEQRLMDQLAAADAMIAQFERQAVYMSSMFQAMAGNSRNG